jgi:3-methyladenine DNA glycosylase AlkD
MTGMAPSSSGISTLAEFNARLETLQRAADSSSHGQPGRIPMGQIFELAKDFVSASLEDIEALLDSPSHPRRVAAVSIMDFQARRKATPNSGRRELYELYRRRHDRIDSWDLVDRAAPHVVGGYLWDKSREPLYLLAASPHWYERRTSIVSTWFFIRRGDLDDTFRIGQILANDPHDLVQKAVGGWIREAGKRDEQRLRDYLDRNAATMPRTALRYAIEHLPPEVRDHYLGRKHHRPPRTSAEIRPPVTD